MLVKLIGISTIVVSLNSSPLANTNVFVHSLAGNDDLSYIKKLFEIVLRMALVSTIAKVGNYFICTLIYRNITSL